MKKSQMSDRMSGLGQNGYWHGGGPDAYQHEWARILGVREQRERVLPRKRVASDRASAWDIADRAWDDVLGTVAVGHIGAGSRQP